MTVTSIKRERERGREKDRKVGRKDGEGRGGARRGLRTSTSSIAWELVSNADSQALLPISETPGAGLSNPTQ